ncbi:hypothetical protein COLO4_25156 [Corchorus olitorius]|uniref:GRF-type domain-containing protein n=1 Tax=Corchorus olitorius TaxID=93759 RepID=A0A1R3I4H9_9ROSI|nr:hypothetical protein COLO4_25156 [Corchorus olitorius]
MSSSTSSSRFELVLQVLIDTGSTCRSGGDCLNLSSYKLITSSFPVEKEYVGVPIYCFCNKKTVRRCSWTDLNPGRRFYRCDSYSDHNYGFHTWHDPVFSEIAKEVIMELKMMERFLHDNVKQLKKEVASLKNNVVEILEADIIEENITLKHGVRLLRLQLNEASGVSVIISVSRRHEQSLYALP